jgi:hypothetical protein
MSAAAIRARADLGRLIMIPGAARGWFTLCN